MGKLVGNKVQCVKLKQIFSATTCQKYYVNEEANDVTCVEKVEAWPQGKCVEHLTHEGKEYCAKIVYLSPRFFCQDYVRLKGTSNRIHKYCIKMLTIYGKKYHIVFCKEKGEEIKIELSEDGLGRPILIESTETDTKSPSFVIAESENSDSTSSSEDDVEVGSSSTATTSEGPSLDDDDTSSEGDVIVSNSATTTEVPSNEISEEDSDSKSDSDSNSDSSGSVVIETAVGHVTQTTTHSESNSSSNTQVVGNTTI